MHVVSAAAALCRCNSGSSAMLAVLTLRRVSAWVVVSFKAATADAEQSTNRHRRIVCVFLQGKKNSRTQLLVFQVV